MTTNTKPVALHTVSDGSVFRVVSPKVEGHKHVVNSGMYRKEADSHSINLANNNDCIFHRESLVQVIPNSRFSR